MIEDDKCRRKLQKGSYGDDVEEIQRALLQLRFDPGRIDGQFGEKTENAVISFQRANGISADGVVRVQTADAILKATSHKSYATERVTAMVEATWLTEPGLATMPGELPFVLPLRDGAWSEENINVIVRAATFLTNLEDKLETESNKHVSSSDDFWELYDVGASIANDFHHNRLEAKALPFHAISGFMAIPDLMPNHAVLITQEEAFFAPAAWGLNDWLWKLLVALGGGNEAYNAIKEILDSRYADLMKRIAISIDAKDWKLLRSLIRRLLGILFSKEFFKELVEKIGENAAKKIVGKWVSKAIPLVGWGILIGLFLAAIIAQAIAG